MEAVLDLGEEKTNTGVRSGHWKQLVRPVEPRKVELQERDYQIFMALNEQRVLTSPLIGQVFFPNKSAGRGQAPDVAKRRLSLLWQAGYIDRVGEIIGEPGIIYTLSDLGKAHLRRYAVKHNLDIVTPDKRGQNPSPFFIEHTLGIARFWAGLTLACAQTDINLSDWMGERALKSKGLVGRFYIRKGIKEEEHVIMPDGTFRLDTPAQSVRYFLEVDRGTESLSEIRAKMEGYEVYRHTKYYMENYPQTKCFVIWVTLGSRRLEHILRESHEVAQARRGSALTGVIGTTIDRVSPQSILAEPIWTSAGQAGERTLLAGL